MAGSNPGHFFDLGVARPPGNCGPVAASSLHLLRVEKEAFLDQLLAAPGLPRRFGGKFPRALIAAEYSQTFRSLRDASQGEVES